MPQADGQAGLKRRLKIAVVTTGRFHVCELARELALLGHDVKFYSLVPPWRTKKYGLPGKCNRWILPRVAVHAMAVKLARSHRSKDAANHKLLDALNRSVCRLMEPCDLLVGMSGMCNQVAGFVKERFGARVWIQRCSRHIESQREILSSLPSAAKVSDEAVRRELLDYDNADRIVVLSKHSEDSFLERGFVAEKLYKNLPGVDLRIFTGQQAPMVKRPTVIMVGIWCMRKGCDVLVKAWRQLPDVQLVHVGPVGDCPLPSDAGFIHHDSVDQEKLSGFYASSHVLALASREDGFGYVLVQALASGLKLVCSTRTGGEDLKRFANDPSAISLVPPDDADALAQALKRALDDAVQERGMRCRMTENARAELTWAAHAMRFENAVLESLNESGGH